MHTTEEAFYLYSLVITAVSYGQHPACEIQFDFQTMIYG